MATAARSAAIAAVVALTVFGCGGAGAGRDSHAPPDRLQTCVDEWNRPANFAGGRPGLIVRRLRPRPVVPLFAHVSLDEDRRCVVFLDTPSTDGDRRFARTRGHYVLDCAGDCGQDVPHGARTFQFLRDGTLPAPGE